MARKDRGTVYSTDHGRTCPECGEPSGDCRCRTGAAGSPGSTAPRGRIRVQRSTKGRKGKTVSVITGLQLNALELAGLARELKQRCGSGGTAKDGVIEIQGDHVEVLVEFLRKRGLGL